MAKNQKTLLFLKKIKQKPNIKNINKKAFINGGNNGKVVKTLSRFNPFIFAIGIPSVETFAVCIINETIDNNATHKHIFKSLNCFALNKS